MGQGSTLLLQLRLPVRHRHGCSPRSDKSDPERGKAAVDRYLRFLKSGDSDYPIELLKAAGVDMTTAKPIEQAIESFNRLLGQLEEEPLVKK